MTFLLERVDNGAFGWVYGDEIHYESGRSCLIACASFSPTS